MIIDSHQHFWKYDPVKDPWITNSMEVIRKDFLPKDLKPILETNKFDGCIAVQAAQSEEETEFLLQCSKENQFIKGVVGWVDLRAANIEERLVYFSKDKKFKGVRHIVQMEKDDFVLGSDFQNGISKLEQFELTYDILVNPKQLPAAVELVKKFPKQQFILDHIAKPKISQKLEEQWLESIQNLATYQNVSCKLSGLVTETEDLKWNESDFTPFLNVIVDSFGVDRLLFGSDWPVCLLAAEYKEVLQIIQNYLNDFSIEDKAKIFGKNAIRIYNL
jgi:L-fuconolactonase